MSGLTNEVLDRADSGLSRRGFMALAGKVTAALGLAMVGAGTMPQRVMAGTCCTGTPCGAGGNPPCGGGGASCPPTCTVYGAPNVCCDSGYVGATNTLHQCLTCNCAGVGGGICICESDTGTPC